MKISLVILLFFSTILVYAQKEHGTIYFKDGTLKKGLVKIKNNHELKFKENKDTKEAIIYTFATVKKVQIEGFQMRYYKKTNEAFQPNRLVYKLIDGKVNLYMDEVSTTNSQGMVGGTALKYYVDKENEDVVQIYPGTPLGKSSDRIIAEYFKDCPKLIALLDRDAFRKSVKMRKGRRSQFRLEEIVKYYNENCN
nr:hypothetical protein [uncultured Psychroserpens sp.]